MLRFLARTLGLWLIAAALVAAVVDGAKSIAASAIVLTPLSETAARLASFGRRGAAEPAAEAARSWPVDAVLGFLLSAPTVAVLAAVGVFLLFAGRRRRSQYLGRGYPA